MADKLYFARNTVMRITILAALFILVSCDGTDQSKYEESIHSLESSFVVGRGHSKMDSGDYRGAIEDFNKAIQLDPNDAIAYNSRGMSKRNLGDYRGAIEDYNRAIQLVPNYAIAYINRGLSKLLIGDFNGGCLDLSRAGELGQMEAYDLIGEYCH